MISIVFDIRHFVLSVQAETTIYQSRDLMSTEKEEEEEHKKKNQSGISICAKWLVHVLAMQLLCVGNVPPHCLVYKDKVLTVLPARRQHWTGLQLCRERL